MVGGGGALLAFFQLEFGGGLIAVGDDRVFDAVVGGRRKNAAVEQVELCPIGAETDDACRPDLRDAGRLQQLIQGGVIDVDAIFGRAACGGARVPGALPRRFLRGGQRKKETDCSSQGRTEPDSTPYLHEIILH